MNKEKQKKLRSRHERYKAKGLYKYIGVNAIKIVFFYSLFIVLMYLAGKYLFDLKSTIAFLVNSLPDIWVLVLFFVSESFLGLVPVDLFVFWSMKFQTPLMMLALLGCISYLGGIISYHIGVWLSGRPKIKSIHREKASQLYNVCKKMGWCFYCDSCPLSL